ncbi:junctional adhesion molecule B-like [Paramuricea clavata]|uniref:Junctional adhesion molecule B-like n=1 Tax=Paramuricea clavata TaxID=317549 RepID=A0A6S7J6D6_PARCT|nr:junctional adhesion molecule B-like [Paramuricea clavata]
MNDGNFANIVNDGHVVENPQYSPGPFKIAKPSTLILENVTIQHNGTYRFLVVAMGQIYTSEVTVFVAGKCLAPTVTINCSSIVRVNEGDGFACVCRGEGGNPPANVTWYKDGDPIGGTGNKEQTLTLRNVHGTDTGTYKCVAQIHTLTDEKLVEGKVILDFPPEEPYFKEKAIVGKTFAITCECSGHSTKLYYNP